MRANPLSSAPIRAALVLVAAFALAALLLACFNPGNAAASLRAFFLGPLRGPFFIGNMLNAAVAIAFSGLGAALAFRSGIVNLGGEGFIYSGALAGFLAAAALPVEAGTAGMALAAASAFASASLLGGLPSLLRRGRGWDELITSFLLAQALIPLVDWLIAVPLRDPGSQIVATSFLPAALRPALLMAPSSLNASAFIALGACLIAFIAQKRSYWGFRQGSAGRSPLFAASIGWNTGALRAQALMLSSGIMGLGGFLSMLGSQGRLIRSFSSGMGWTGLACAIVAGFDPLVLPFAAILFAYLDSGTTQAQFAAGIPAELSGIVQAAVFFMASSAGLFMQRKRRDA